MKEVIKEIRENYPAFVGKKEQRPRPPKHIRQANGRRPNCHAVPMRPEYGTIQLPEA